jgi:tetratricopeptide (TPR) repeat protein
MDLRNEGIQRAKEASEILEPLGDAVEQTECLIHLAYALRSDNQFDSAEEAASRGINLLSERGEEFRLCQGHRVLGDIYQSKGMMEKAIHHLDVALRIASSLNLHDEWFWVHLTLAEVFSGQGRFDDAHAHAERTKLCTVNNAYHLACASHLQARFWY